MGKQVKLLLVDDDVIFKKTLKRLLTTGGLDAPVVEASNGEEALSILKNYDPANEDEVLVVLLDINMPVMSGFELLEELRQNPSFNRLPIFILSTSSDSDDVAQAYELNVAGYLHKNAALEKLQEQIGFLDGYLHSVVLQS